MNCKCEPQPCKTHNNIPKDGWSQTCKKCGTKFRHWSVHKYNTTKCSGCYWN